MDCFFVNNLDLPNNTRKRKTEFFDKFIDEYFVPADMVCIAGGISEYLDIEVGFLIRLSKKYPNVFYVHGGCDLKSDIPLDFKFDKISNSFRGIQDRLCIPTRLDGDSVKTGGISVAGFMGFDMDEDISGWDWWTDVKTEYMSFERGRYMKIIENSTDRDIMVSYYGPKSMNIDNIFKVWHYGYGNKKEISESDGKLLITNSCNADDTKYSKKDFLIKL